MGSRHPRARYSGRKFATTRPPLAGIASTSVSRNTSLAGSIQCRSSTSTTLGSRFVAWTRPADEVAQAPVPGVALHRDLRVPPDPGRRGSRDRLERPRPCRGRYRGPAAPRGSCPAPRRRSRRGDAEPVAQQSQHRDERDVLRVGLALRLVDADAARRGTGRRTRWHRRLLPTPAGATTPITSPLPARERSNAASSSATSSARPTKLDNPRDRDTSRCPCAVPAPSSRKTCHRARSRP